MAFRRGNNNGRNPFNISPVTSPRNNNNNYRPRGPRRIARNNNNNNNTSSFNDRPIMSGGNRTFASGRSSYNLNFIDLENEWERLDQDELDDLIDEDEEMEANLQRQWSIDYNTYLEELDNNNNNNNNNNSNITNNNNNLARGTNPNANINMNSRAQALTATALEHGFNGLNPTIAASLKVIVFQGDTQNNVCGVCLDNINTGDRIYDLKCFHQFHVKCLRPWLPRSSLCPMCRQEIEPKPEERLKTMSNNDMKKKKPSRKK